MNVRIDGEVYRPSIGTYEWIMEVSMYVEWASDVCAKIVSHDIVPGVILSY